MAWQETIEFNAPIESEIDFTSFVRVSLNFLSFVWDEIELTAFIKPIVYLESSLGVEESDV